MSIQLKLIYSITNQTLVLLPVGSVKDVPATCLEISGKHPTIQVKYRLISESVKMGRMVTLGTVPMNASQKVINALKKAVKEKEWNWYDSFVADLKEKGYEMNSVNLAKQIGHLWA